MLYLSYKIKKECYLLKIQKSINTKDIGAKIKHLRKMRSMTQDELGVVLGGLSRGQKGLEPLNTFLTEKLFQLRNIQNLY
jgi:hypothetical protein